MIKRTLLVITFILANRIYSHCQIVLMLTDSVGISVNFPSVTHSEFVNGNHSYIFFIDENYHLQVYDYSGRKIHKSLDTTLMNKLISYAKKITPYSIMKPYTSNNEENFIIKAYKSLLFIDKDFKVYKKYQPSKSKFTGIQPCFDKKLFLAPDKRTFISLLYFMTGPIGGGEFRNSRIMKKVGTFVTCLISDSLKSYKVIGEWGRPDTAYQNRLLPYLIQYDVDINREYTQLFFTQAATHTIEMWDIEKKLLVKRFGIPAKHFNSDYHVPVVWNKKNDNSRKADYSQILHRKIECTTYEKIEYDDTHKLVYRIYRTGKKDTVRHHIKTKQEWREYKKKHKKLCASELPEIWQNQVRLEQSKPYGLQIYNEKYELIFDEIMPTPFNILKIEDNEIWVHGRYDEANQKYWIYKYRIETK